MGRSRIRPRRGEPSPRTRIRGLARSAALRLPAALLVSHRDDDAGDGEFLVGRRRGLGDRRRGVRASRVLQRATRVRGGRGRFRRGHRCVHADRDRSLQRGALRRALPHPRRVRRLHGPAAPCVSNVAQRGPQRPGIRPGLSGPPRGARAWRRNLRRHRVLDRARRDGSPPGDLRTGGDGSGVRDRRLALRGLSFQPRAPSAHRGEERGEFGDRRPDGGGYDLRARGRRGR